MRVLVEILDKEPIENVLGACIFEPEIVVFLCDIQDSDFFKEATVYRLFRLRKLKSKPRFYYFDATKPAEIRRVLAAVVRDYPDCIFDYSGGKDLALLQAGAYCLPLGVPGYYIDIPAGRFVNVQHCAALTNRFRMPAFSAEDVFALTGAAIKGSGHFGTNEITEEFEADVLAVWQMVQTNPKAWGEFVAYLQAVCAGTSITTLQASGPRRMKSGRYPARFIPAIFSHLHAHGLLGDYRDNGKQVHFAFKSPLHKKCLLNQGIWLELFCYVAAKQSGLFDDVRTSVVVDWAAAPGNADSTKNEVDVVLVKGVVPLFISCKMSAPSPLALTEIRVLSSKFGGSLSRTMLITADILGDDYKALKMRAADLDILLLDGTALKRHDFVQILAGAVRGRNTLD